MVVALALLAGILFLSLGPGPWVVDKEKAFDGQLHNSLYYLDIAKYAWKKDNHKTQSDIPTLNELKPYLGTNMNRIERFKSLGITYTITNTAERQSDIATVTHDLCFRRGPHRLYPAGTSYCIHTGWTYSPLGIQSVRALSIEHNLDYLLEAAFIMLVAGNVLAFWIKKPGNAGQAHSP